MNPDDVNDFVLVEPTVAYCGFNFVDSAYCSLRKGDPMYLSYL